MQNFYYTISQMEISMQKTVINKILLTGLMLNASWQIHSAAQKIDNQERTAWLNEKLLDAANTNKYHIIKPLIAARAHLETVDADGNTPLILASRRHTRDTVEALLTAKANPNASNIWGNTALHYAVNQGDYIVDVLIKNEANIHIINIDGMKPLMKKLLHDGKQNNTLHHISDDVTEALFNAGATIESTFAAYKNTLIEQCPIREHVNSKKIAHEELSSLETILPVEVLMLIFKLLPEQDIINVRSVNSYWCLYAHDLFKQYKNELAAEKLSHIIKTMIAGIKTIEHLPHTNFQKAKCFLEKESNKTKKLNLFSSEAICFRQHSTPPTKLSSATEIEEYLQALVELQEKVEAWEQNINTGLRDAREQHACVMLVKTHEEFIDLLQIGLLFDIPQITTERLANQKQLLLDAIEQLEELEEQLDQEEELEINGDINESVSAIFD